MIVLVVGTGTDVGKTHITCCLLAARRGSPLRISAFKPVLTGAGPAMGSGSEAADAPTDVDAHARWLDVRPPPPLFAFSPPVSPHLAARLAGVVLSVEDIADHAATLAASFDLLLVETAGGLFSPIGETTTSADLAAALVRRGGLRVLLVAPDRVGVLHDLRATLWAAHHVGLTVHGVVLSAPASPDATTGTNAAEATTLGTTSVAAVFPRAAPDDPASLEAASRTFQALKLDGT